VNEACENRDMTADKTLSYSNNLLVLLNDLGHTNNRDINNMRDHILVQIRSDVMSIAVE
jgi:hypothetical protein